MAKVKSGYVEVARSFSFRLNVGNYQSADFFCSHKEECLPEDAEETAERLYKFCRSQVQKSVAQFKAEAHDDRCC